MSLWVPVGSIWCISSSPLARAAIGLLGPTSAIWFWQVWRAKGYKYPQGDQTDIALAERYAKGARFWLIPVMLFWIINLIFYSGAYAAVEGKGCDAKLTARANLWIGLWTWSLLPLIVTFMILAYQHLQFKRYDEAARSKSANSSA